jgi:aryl-alcohol dehydrogenase-like predicted oxidoreductase
MRYQNLGASGLRVPELSLGTGTFGGSGPLFGEWGTTGPEQARRLLTSSPA